MKSVKIEESVFLQGAFTDPLTCVAHFELHKKSLTVFSCDVVRFGGGGGGGIVRWSMFQEVGGLYGVSERVGWI